MPIVALLVGLFVFCTTAVMVDTRLNEAFPDKIIVISRFEKDDIGVAYSAPLQTRQQQLIRKLFGA